MLMGGAKQVSGNLFTFSRWHLFESKAVEQLLLELGHPP